MNWIKKYWLEILVFGIVFAILMIDLNPDFTFMNKAADSIGEAIVSLFWTANDKWFWSQMVRVSRIIVGVFFVWIGYCYA